MAKPNTIISEVLSTCADRGKVYGPPHKDYERTAKLWSAFLGVPITAAQATACMMLVKLSRLAESPTHRDSLLDVAGYAHCYEDCINNAPAAQIRAGIEYVDAPPEMGVVILYFETSGYELSESFQTTFYKDLDDRLDSIRDLPGFEGSRVIIERIKNNDKLVGLRAYYLARGDHA